MLAKLCPPNNRSVREVAAEEGISEATLYNWRRKARERGGLYPQPLQAWREACERANDWAAEKQKEQAQQGREQGRRIRDLERELRRKERALAETAALLSATTEELPDREARAIWGECEDE